MVTPGVVRLVAFAAARDLLGRRELELPLDRPCTAAELWPILLRAHPTLAPYASTIQLAINGTWALPGDPVAPGDEVALLPPVSGG